MDKLERARRLKKLLEQIAPRKSLESLPRPTPKAQGSLESMDPTAPIASALQKLAENRHLEITPAEMFGLEAIVLPQNRPVTFIRENSYDELGDPWRDLNNPTIKARLDPLLPLIGRVELPRSPIIPYAGTGFVVGNGLLATNRHVAELFSQGLGLTITYRAGDSAVNFRRQVDTEGADDSATLTVLGVEMIHPFWDMALLRVAGLPTKDVLRLSIKSPEELIGRNVVVIGYPARDPRSDIELQDRIFGSKYLVKRLQPGVVRERARIQSFENAVNAITHDASTLGGNSGSAVIDVESGEVVALHFAGEYLKANYAVPMYELARDARVAPKLNFDGSLAPTNDWAVAWRRVEGDEAVPTAKPRVSFQPSSDRLLQSPSRVVGASPHDRNATWTIPLHISVAVGQPSSPAVTVAGLIPQVPAAGATEVEEAVVIDQDYSDRTGYDPKFLDDIEVSLPTLADDMKNDTAQVDPDARRNGDPYELAYYHYSVYMNKRRRTAWFSAANVDGDHRPSIGRRQGDRWYVDPRIQKSEQLGQEAFEHGIDRGHLTRREDTAWGEDVDSAVKANNDTFHFTNCSLQASPFNRGKDRWQGLEQFLLEQHAKKDKRRMVVITGPLFASNDPVYKNDRMTFSVRCPLQFWKVCVLIRQNGTPSATAFILGQEDIQDLPGFEEAFDVMATQIKIIDLEKRTGLDFGDIKEHDHFAAGGTPGTLELPAQGEWAKRAAKPIRNQTDIVV